MGGGKPLLTGFYPGKFYKNLLFEIIQSIADLLAKFLVIRFHLELLHKIIKNQKKLILKPFRCFADSFQNMGIGFGKALFYKNSSQLLFEFFTDRENLLLSHLPQPDHIRHAGDLNQTGIPCQKPGKIVEAVLQQLKIKTLQQQLLLV